ncbi:MAG: DegT/DnrJ/EryC1/StrS family aminotransferase [candidate division WS1 bacterium]|nr:DegT/DnrJ/EryC1/StrS family aminotransferase [candidate division WS1 bacterium]
MGKLAIRGGAPLRTEPYPSWPVFDETEIQAVTEVLRSGKWWYGEKVREFEAAYAAFQDAQYGVTCTNGTAALEIAYLACGLGAGDEVIVPAYTFIATASSLLRVNAIPIFADLELDTGNLDPADVEAKITDRTKAIVPVHFGGYIADMDAFRALAKKHNLHLIEDACHSWGGKWQGKGTGALGDCGVFSFQMSKNITSGEGGILVSDNEEIAELARSYSNVGRATNDQFYRHFLPGGNLRMTEMQAALLLVQLSRLEEQTLRREANAEYLNRALAGIPGIALQRPEPRITRRAYHMYIFRFLPEQWPGVSRERFLEAVCAEGGTAWAGYPIPLYQNPVFQRQGTGPENCPLSCPFYGKEMDYTQVHLPRTEQLCAEACWVPHATLLAEEADMQDLADIIAKVWENQVELAS